MMADPLSIIAGVITIATVLVQSSKALSKLIDNIKGAPGVVKAVACDVHTFRSIISSLKFALEERDIKDAVSIDTALVEMIGSLLNPLSNCEEALQNLIFKIQSRLECSESNAFRATVLNLKWGLFVKKEVKDLESRLEATKSTLDTALDIIAVYVLLSHLIPATAYAEEIKAL